MRAHWPRFQNQVAAVFSFDAVQISC